MLRDVNTTDISDAIHLGCETMQRVFNPNDDNCPYFDARAWPSDEVGFGFMSLYTEAHVPGRHLLALLDAEDAVGASVSDEAITRHRRALMYSLNNPLKLPLNRVAMGDKPTVFADHNLREALHGLYALVRFRSDTQAEQVAEQIIDAVFDLWKPDTGWNVPPMEAAGFQLEERTFVWGPARCIGSLVRYHQATQSSRALELAVMLAGKATDEFYAADGAFNRERFGSHTHSATCTLSGLAQLAALQGDQSLMSRVRAFYDNGLNALRDELGWVQEHVGTTWSNPERGECNNTGDILEAALTLAAHGYPTYYADTERMLRCHLLPAQLRDVSFIEQPENPESRDAMRDVAERMRGAWGFPAPYGHRPLDVKVVDFCLDIVGGTVSSLCEAWRACVSSDKAGTRVNMLFDRDHPAVSIESPYTHDALRVTPRKPGPLSVRIPPWVDRASLKVDVPGDVGHQWIDAYLYFDKPRVGEPISIRFDLAPSEIALHHVKHDIRVQLQGDAVSAMDGFGDDLNFFPPVN